MKKLFATLLTLTLLVGTMATTAFAVDCTTPTPTQVGSITLSNVVGSETVSGITMYACEDLTVVTINENIRWMNLYAAGETGYIPLNFDSVYTEERLPIFNIDNMNVVMSDTNKTYTMAEFMQAISTGEVDFQNDPCYIPAGSSFVLLVPNEVYVLETILRDGIESEVCYLLTGDFDGIPTVLDDTPEPETTTPEETSFSDVAEGAPYEDAVLWAVGAGVTTGYDDGTFRPDNTCTRGQVVTFLYRAAGEPEVTTTENPFSDVSEDSPFYDAILWAVENGITTGYDDGTFRPTNTCTSAQVITFLHRAEGAPEADFDSEIAATANAAYAPAITWADAIGLLDGMDFVPSAVSPRSDIVTYLYQVANTVEMA